MSGQKVASGCRRPTAWRVDTGAGRPVGSRLADGPTGLASTLPGIASPRNPAPSGNLFLAGARLCGLPNGLSRVWSACWDGASQVGVYVSDTGAVSIRTASDSGGVYGIQLATSAGGAYDGAVRYSIFQATIDGSAGTTKVYLDGAELTALTLTGVNTKPQAGGLWNSVGASESGCSCVTD